MDALVESLENAFQIAVLFSCGIFLLVRMRSVRDKSILLLFSFYISFLLGDLYWQVCLLCYGNIPQVSIVSDLSWYAAYLFLYLLLRTALEEEDSGIYDYNTCIPWLFPVFTAAMAVFYIQNGKIFSNIVYAALMGLLLYTTVKGLLQSNGEKAFYRQLYITVLIFCLLEYALWTVSCFWDRVIFRYVYFCVDIMITLCFPRFIPIIKREVER